MKKEKEQEKDGNRAKEKKHYIGPRVTVLSAKSAQARKLVDEFGSGSGNEDQQSDTALKPEAAKAKKRSA